MIIKQLFISNLNNMQVDHYCEHFKNLKLTKNINFNQSSSCKYCMFGKTHLWLCMSKNCATFLCDRNSNQHLLLHLQQTRAKKSFHSIYINVLTAKIICVHCHIEIYDLDQLKNVNRLHQFQNPYLLRLKILPALAQFEGQKNKVIGQLENSEGHRRINKALTGLFGNKYNHPINSAVQFLMQFKYYRSILFELKLTKQSKILNELRQIFIQAESAKLRAIRTDELTKLLYDRNPELLGYSRKDPFEHVIFFMNLLHEQIKYYAVSSVEEERDEWELLSKASSSVILNCPFYDSISCSLNMNYVCQECKIIASDPVNINFIKLNFPKKKRKVKEVQKELAQHRCTSPVKNRRNSLINFFMPEQECPFTVPQLIIDLLKQPLHKEKVCQHCKNPMMFRKPHFSNLSDYLLIVINRMGKDGNSIDETALELDFTALDMGPFTQNKESIILYDLEAAVCLEKGCLFPVIAEGQYNKQKYMFKNEFVSLLRSQKDGANPYILCYKKRVDEVVEKKTRDVYNNVASNITISENMSLQSDQFCLLPDFWISQLKFSIIKPLNSQLVCRHGYRKPSVNSKMITSQRIPTKVFQFLVQQYGGQVYRNKECEHCDSQLQRLAERRHQEKQRIVEYDRMKTNCFCMISSQWIKKWMNFLYFKGQHAYFSKGYPLPGAIENKGLLEGTKCRKNLHRNVDYKVVNIFVWRFLKDLYGGGPEIRYKWNQNDLKKVEEEKLQEIRKIAKGVKQIFMINYPESPKKSVIIERTTSFVQSGHESELGSELCPEKEQQVEMDE